jgi:hypothetical protein
MMVACVTPELWAGCLKSVVSGLWWCFGLQWGHWVCGNSSMLTSCAAGLLAR